MRNAVIIDPHDSVAVAIEPVRQGETVLYECEGREIHMTAREDIAIYHKIAVRDIIPGEPVVKYGEHIGIASWPIQKGGHVHTHNLEIRRESLETGTEEEKGI